MHNRLYWDSNPRPPFLVPGLVPEQAQQGAANEADDQRHDGREGIFSPGKRRPERFPHDRRRLRILPARQTLPRLRLPPELRAPAPRRRLLPGPAVRLHGRPPSEHGARSDAPDGRAHGGTTPWASSPVRRLPVSPGVDDGRPGIRRLPRLRRRHDRATTS